MIIPKVKKSINATLSTRCFRRWKMESSHLPYKSIKINFSKPPQSLIFIKNHPPSRLLFVKRRRPTRIPSFISLSQTFQYFVLLFCLWFVFGPAEAQLDPNLNSCELATDSSFFEIREDAPVGSHVASLRIGSRSSGSGSGSGSGNGSGSGSNVRIVFPAGQRDNDYFQFDVTWLNVRNFQGIT